ncbi:MAG TPA: two-component sensor histidine kinase [Lachnospiraceae bacterium]|nr:two-component sensor histidine kinase [Lachnospiraceae bacterium]
MLTQDDYEKLNRFYEENRTFRELFQAIEKDHLSSLSKISHEIRNPVTLINSFLQMLAAEHPEVCTYRYWDDIMENMTFLRELLTDLSDYNNARILHKSETNPYWLLSSVVESVRPSLREQHVDIQLNKESAIPSFFIDGTRIREVLLNLIRNAAEAMPDGGEITCSIFTDGDRLFIRIRDNGPGIPEEYLPTIFDTFVTHKKDGTGLGLSIARTIAEAHGGTLSIFTDLGKGSEFTLMLPIVYA